MSKSAQAPTFRAGVIFSLVAQGTIVSALTILALRAAMLSVHPGAVTVAVVSPPGDSVIASGQTQPTPIASADPPNEESASSGVSQAVHVAPLAPTRGLAVAEPAQLIQEARLAVSPPLPADTALNGEVVSVPAMSVAGPGEGSGRPSLEEFLREVSNRLEASKRYPEPARRLGEEGATRLQFTITPSGESEHILLAQSSGWETLDQETVELVKRVGRFPLPPVTWKEGITIQAPVVFQLRSP